MKKHYKKTENIDNHVFETNKKHAFGFLEICHKQSFGFTNMSQTKVWFYKYFTFNIWRLSYTTRFVLSNRSHTKKMFVLRNRSHTKRFVLSNRSHTKMFVLSNRSYKKLFVLSNRSHTKVGLLRFFSKTWISLKVQWWPNIVRFIAFGQSFFALTLLIWNQFHWNLKYILKNKRF